MANACAHLWSQSTLIALLAASRWLKEQPHDLLR
jgi:hypothetical protein